MRESTVSAAIVIDMVSYLVARGFTGAEVCRQARIAPDVLQSPDERVPGSLVERLWAVGTQLTGDSDLGLHAAEVHNPGALDIVGYVVLNCRTVGDALDRLSRYAALVNDGLRVVIHREDEHVVCRCEAIAGLDNYLLRAPRQAMEAIAAGTARALATLANEPIVPVDVGFRHEAPDSIREHERLLGLTPCFQQVDNRIVFRAADLARTVRSSNPALLQIFECHAEAMLAELSEHGPVSRRVLMDMTSRLKGGVPTLNESARALAKSDRNLQRVLKQEGTSHQLLLDHARRELALRHLATPQGSAAEVAFLLGFSDASAFTRAFRRWTGSTPGAWRVRQHGARQEY